MQLTNQMSACFLKTAWAHLLFAFYLFRLLVICWSSFLCLTLTGFWIFSQRFIQTGCTASRCGAHEKTVKSTNTKQKIGKGMKIRSNWLHRYTWLSKFLYSSFTAFFCCSGNLKKNMKSGSSFFSIQSRSLNKKYLKHCLVCPTCLT